jgi:outer membrane protein assembly factor BamB
MGLDLKTGQPMWSHDSRTAMVEQPLLHGQEILFLKEVGHTLVYLDANTGQHKKDLKIAGAGLTSVFKRLLPVQGGIAIIGEKTLRVLIDEGGQSWGRPITNDTLVSSTGRWILLAQKKLECLDSATGKQVWAHELGPSDKKELVCTGDLAGIETEKEILIFDCPSGKKLPIIRCPGSMGIIAANRKLWVRSHHDSQTFVTSSPGDQKMTFAGHLFLFHASHRWLVAATGAELIVMKRGD